MRNEKTCCIIGHQSENLPFGGNKRDSRYASFKIILEQEIRKQIKENSVTHFISPINNGAELIAADIITGLQEQYRKITLTAFLPYEAQAQDWPEGDRDRFFEIVECCNEERMTSFRYDDMTISKNTEAMFDLADVVIAVWNGKPGEIDYAILRAEKRGIPTVIVRVDEYYN